jgi:thiamine biosynthesis lipoprotein
LKNSKFFGLFLLPLLFFACGKPEVKKWDREQFVFGTYIVITVYDADKKLAESAMDAAFAEMVRVDRTFNSKTEGSLTDTLNRKPNSPGSPKEVPLDAEGEALFDRIRSAFLLSGGEYDVTLGPLMALWPFDRAGDADLRVPAAEEIARAREKVDFSKVVFGEGRLRMDWPVEEIDTGSFLKGYALGKARDKMAEMGVKSALLSSVSSIATIGAKPGGAPWRIGVQDPGDPSGALGIVELNNRSMGVSGDYQTYVTIEGKRYHHILQKSTGYPAGDKKMVVVIAPDAFLADVYSTCFFVMPVDKVLDFVYTNKYLDVLIVKSDGSIAVSENFDLMNTKKP